ncbi:hypothetical protein ACQFX9_09115 [Aliinostoc sp. HNIBRCY26]
MILNRGKTAKVLGASTSNAPAQALIRVLRSSQDSRLCHYLGVK